MFMTACHKRAGMNGTLNSKEKIILKMAVDMTELSCLHCLTLKRRRCVIPWVTYCASAPLFLPSVLMGYSGDFQATM